MEMVPIGQDIIMQVVKHQRGNNMSNEFNKVMIEDTVAVELPMSKFCNLRCSYCYITDETYKTYQVKYDELRKIIDKLPEIFINFKNKEKKLYLIPWGAEPLCNWKVIEKLLREELSSNRLLVTKWSTNATFIPDGYINFIKEFLPQIDGVQISLDGPQEVQDTTRKTVAGKGTFKNVMNHIETLRTEFPSLPLNFKPTLNSSQIERGFFYKSVKFFLVDMKEELAPTSFVTDSPYSLQAIKQFRADLENIYQEWTDIKKVNPNASISIIKKFGEATDIHCSALRNEVGIDLDGNIYPCHSPITGSRKLRELYTLGNVFTGKVDQDGIYRFMYMKYNSKILTSPLCKDCLVYQTNPAYCYTCPFDCMRSTGSTWMILPSVCEMRRIVAEFFNRWNNDY